MHLNNLIYNTKRKRMNTIKKYYIIYTVTFKNMKHNLQLITKPNIILDKYIYEMYSNYAYLLLHTEKNIIHI